MRQTGEKSEARILLTATALCRGSQARPMPDRRRPDRSPVRTGARGGDTLQASVPRPCSSDCGESPLGTGRRAGEASYAETQQPQHANRAIARRTERAHASKSPS